jgi:hypothetical protein
LYAFFLSIIQRINRNYHNLFTGEQSVDGEGSPFMARWGWVFQTKQVADFNNIKVNEAYDLRVIEYLNCLAYLKDYNKHKEFEYKKWEFQARAK